MANLKIYEINSTYIDYLAQYENHIFHNAKSNQSTSRKYIGIVLSINDIDYFVPLSSFKKKHKRFSETVDFIKIGDFAVLNINNMIPVPQKAYSLYNIFQEKNIYYKNLLNTELRIIKSKETLIIENAKKVYEHKLRYNNESKLGKRCNNFVKLEKLCKEF